MTLKVKTVATDEPTYEGFRQLAKEYHLSNPELLAAMVQYFRVTKADPREPTGPDLTTSLAMLGDRIDKLDKRTIGFIREQEKNFLKPILAEVQAHKVLSTPAANAPAGLSKDQLEEMFSWYARVLRKAIVPSQLTAAFQVKVLPPGPANGQEDPALTGLKNGLFEFLRTALQPSLLTPAVQPPPTAPAVSPSPRPA